MSPVWWSMRAIRRVRRLLPAAEAVKAVIRLVSIVRDRGRVEFTYELEGQTVESWTPILQEQAST